LENKAKAKNKIVSKASNGQSYDILILRRVLAHKNSHFSTFRDELKSVPKTLVFETAKPKPKP
jgi:hypothetical protein